MSTWHATPDALVDFATRPEQLDDVTAASVEAHLLACDECRAKVAAAAPTSTVEASWAAIADRIDRPSPSPVERLLRRFGVNASSARLVGATRALQLAWLAALVAVVALAVWASYSNDNTGVFLVAAPLVPMGAVTLSFAFGGEPAGEAAVVAPVAGAGLVVRRAVAVLAASFVALLIGAATLPDLGLVDAAWVLPALGLGLSSLALATWLRIEVAAASCAVGWVSALWYSAIGRTDTVSTVDLAPFAARGQLAFVALSVLALVVLFGRRDTLATLGRQS